MPFWYDYLLGSKADAAKPTTTMAMPMMIKASGLGAGIAVAAERLPWSSDAVSALAFRVACS